MVVDYSFNLKGTVQEVKQQLEQGYRSAIVKKQKYDTPLINWRLDDAHFMAEFEVPDLPAVETLFKTIRGYHNRYKFFHDWGRRLHTRRFENKLIYLENAKDKLLHEYFDCLIDHVNDHKDAYMMLRGRKVIPTKVCFRDDVQTLVGISVDNKNITGEGFTPWWGVAVGSGSEAPYIWSNSLEQEELQQDFSHGFFTASGVAILYAALFGELTPSGTYTEALVRNQEISVGAKVLCKQTFTIDPIDHTQDASGFAVAGLLEYAPIVDMLI